MDTFVKYPINKFNYLKLCKITNNQILHNQSGGLPKKRFIILDGISSSGKTTICNHFSKFGYKCIMGDDYTKKAFAALQRNLKNKYLPEKKKKAKFEKILGDMMVEDAISVKGKVIIDDIDQKYLIKSFDLTSVDKKMKNEIYVIIIYANFSDLARNMESRRREGQPRGMFVFNQFSKKYTKTNNSDSNKIDIINRKKFKEILLSNFKYAFENKSNLIKFSTDIFAEMDIHDDEDHYIKLRDGFKVDYFLDTTGKSKDEIFEELDKVV